MIEYLTASDFEDRVQELVKTRIKGSLKKSEWAKIISEISQVLIEKPCNYEEALIELEQVIDII